MIGNAPATVGETAAVFVGLLLLATSGCGRSTAVDTLTRCLGETPPASVVIVEAREENGDGWFPTKRGRVHFRIDPADFEDVAAARGLPAWDAAATPENGRHGWSPDVDDPGWRVTTIYPGPDLGLQRWQVSPGRDEVHLTFSGM